MFTWNVTRLQTTDLKNRFIIEVRYSELLTSINNVLNLTLAKAIPILYQLIRMVLTNIYHVRSSKGHWWKLCVICWAVHSLIKIVLHDDQWRNMIVVMAAETKESSVQRWWEMDTTAVLNELKTREAGLTDAEVKERQALYGPNAIPSPPGMCICVWRLSHFAERFCVAL